jgi:hypothetical protein
VLDKPFYLLKSKDKYLRFNKHVRLPGWSRYERTEVFDLVNTPQEATLFRRLLDAKRKRQTYKTPRRSIEIIEATFSCCERVVDPARER